MKRREFIAGLGGAAVWPLAARAQQPAIPVIGYLDASAPFREANTLEAFRKGLNETGFIEGQNVAIEYHSAVGQYDRLREIAAEMVRSRVAIIVTPLSVAAALAVRASTSTIPVVFSTGIDPVQAGLVASLAHPGGNVTGVLTMNNEIGAKRLELLHQLVPQAGRFGVLVNPTSSAVAESVMTGLQQAASSIGRQIEFLPASTNREIDAAFSTLGPKRIDALLVSSDLFFATHRAQILTLAAQHRVPVAMGGSPGDAAAGALMTYGSNSLDLYRYIAIYTGRILKGEKPADLPVARPTKFELAINLKTANALGLTIPESLLATADEVIQ
jgi:putative tryptophan/tyrosine transport system substrate-binding protein